MINSAQAESNLLFVCHQSSANQPNLVLTPTSSIGLASVKEEQLERVYNGNNRQGQYQFANNNNNNSRDNNTVPPYESNGDDQEQFLANNNTNNIQSESNLLFVCHQTSNSSSAPIVASNSIVSTLQHTSAQQQHVSLSPTTTPCLIRTHNQRQTSNNVPKSNAGQPQNKRNVAPSTGVQQNKVRRCRHITDYVLADEEKRLLIKEGYTDFPMTCQARPLSKSEERILRKIRRKIRNKKSAQCSRQRKKEYVEDLERKYTAVIRENEELKQVLEKIQRQQQQQQQHEQQQQQQHHHHHHQQQQHQHLHQQQQQQQHGQFHQQGSFSLDWKDFFNTSKQPTIVGNVYN